jgi:cellulose synthase/poly-beta-1,6-N-acetylglucosamine synthase-like glycosyltransferase
VPRQIVLDGLAYFDLAVLGYFFVLNSIYLLFTVLAFLELRRHRRRWTARDLDAVMRSPVTPAISLIVPTYNEEGTIAESVRALLMLNYPTFEIVIVNDGAKDATLEVAIDAFDFVQTEIASEGRLPTRRVRGVYRSLRHPELTLVDKENGGKADAMNAGINFAQHPLVCVIDADSLLEPHALSRAVLPFIEDPDTVGAGGIIRVVNGCRVQDGRVVEVGLPGNTLARFQVVEYLRAFLTGRVAQSLFNGLLIVSGAFGLFRRDAVLAVGGFDRTTIGEDMELTVKLHRWCREQGRGYRITFRADPVCWTEVPETVAVLGSQRNRWQRGTCEVLRRHWRMLFNPRYGAVGRLAMPYYLFFEALGPLVEAAGYIVTIGAVIFGALDWRFAQLLFLVAVCYGALISLAAVLLEELSGPRYPRLRDLLILAALAIVENLARLVRQRPGFQRDTHLTSVPAAPLEPRPGQAFDALDVGSVVHDGDRVDRGGQAIHDALAADARVQPPERHGELDARRRRVLELLNRRDVGVVPEILAHRIAGDEVRLDVELHAGKARRSRCVEGADGARAPHDGCRSAGSIALGSPSTDQTSMPRPVASRRNSRSRSASATVPSSATGTLM